MHVSARACVCVYVHAYTHELILSVYLGHTVKSPQFLDALSPLSKIPGSFETDFMWVNGKNNN